MTTTTMTIEQELIEIKEQLESQTENPSKLRQLLGSKLSRRYGIIEQAIIDLQDQECTRDYVRSNHDGALFFTNTWGDFTIDLDSGTISMTTVCARFNELYDEVKNALYHHASYTFDFDQQAKEELPETYHIEEEFGNLKHSITQITDGIEEICLQNLFSDVIDRLNSLKETVEHVESKFDSRMANLRSNHAQDNKFLFHEKRDCVLAYLDLIKPMLYLLHKDEKPAVSVQFDYKYADDDMENFMSKIAKLVDDFNNSRK